MCLGGPSIPQDNSAEIARKAEEARQAKIAEGRGSIDEAFSTFSDPFYEQRQKAYLGYYEPQLEEQYRDTRQKQILALDRSGNLASGTGAESLADLHGKYLDNRASIAEQAQAYVNSLRGDVATTRDELYAQNRAAADPSAAHASALARAGTFQSPATFSPLGNAFASVVDNAANVVALERKGYPGTGLFNPKTPGKEKVVTA